MKNKYVELLITTLKEYSDILGNNGCNDWSFPEDWTQEEIKEFYEIFSHANCPSKPKGDGNDYSQEVETRYIADYNVPFTLAYILKKEHEEMPKANLASYDYNYGR